MDQADACTTAGDHVERAPPGPETPIQGDKIFDVPPRNQYHLGREENIEEINQILSPTGCQQHAQPRSCLIHAMAGMGKTQIALEYAYRFRPLYDCIFWLEADKAQELAISFASIAEKVGLSQTDSVGLDRKIKVAKDWLQRTGGPHHVVLHLLL